MPRLDADIARIRGGCFIDPDTGCWLWRGATSKGKNKDEGYPVYPRVYMVNYTKDPSGKTKTVQSGGRAVWHAMTKTPIPNGYRVYHVQCSKNLCLNPAHLDCGPTKAWGESVSQKGIWKQQPRRISANRRTGLKLAAASPEQAAIICASDKSNKELIHELGLTRGVVSNIRRGKRAYARQSNPFAGLLKSSNEQN